jgi:hypothetical protein
MGSTLPQPALTRPRRYGMRARGRRGSHSLATRKRSGGSPSVPTASHDKTARCARFPVMKPRFWMLPSARMACSWLQRARMEPRNYGMPPPARRSSISPVIAIGCGLRPSAQTGSVWPLRVGTGRRSCGISSRARSCHLVRTYGRTQGHRF